MEIEKRIIENRDLKDLTTFQIGGRARFFLEVKNEDDLIKVLQWAGKRRLKLFFLGGGSNILFSDEGFDGLILKMANQEFEIKKNLITGGGGLGLVKIIKEASRYGLSGLEWAAGIPGITLGGAIRGNAGAFGFSMAESVKSVLAYDTKQEEWKKFGHKDCLFAYRNSVFKQRPELLIWKADLELSFSESEKVKQEIKENVGKRIKIQPKNPSAGSVFENFQFDYLKQRAPSLADRAQFEGVVKGGMVGAGWVIDQLDLRGKRMGKAQISEKHANFIINLGGASALDVIALVSYVKQKVRQNFNLQLQEEIQYVGF